MRGRSRGFTLTELLTALVIHSFFILMLGGTFYTLISFGSRSQMVMTARERGQRVISYIDSRVRNVGLGMWKLVSSDAIAEALKPMTENHNKALYGLMLPVAVTFEDDDNINNEPLAEGTFKKKSEITGKDGDKNIFCGNVLTMLYSQRETGTSSNSAVLTVYSDIEVPGPYNETTLKELISRIKPDFWEYFFSTVLYKTPDGTSVITVYRSYLTSSGDVEEAAFKTLKDFEASYSARGVTYSDERKIKDITKNNVLQYLTDTSGYTVKYLFLRRYKEGEFYYSDFGEKRESNNRVDSNDIRGWGVSRCTGVPFVVDRNTADKYSVRLTPLSKDVIIPNGDELLYLKCVHLFAENPRTGDKDAGVKERSFKVHKLGGNEWTGNNSKVNPYQIGVLELYAELDTTKHILSVWVLSTGGRDRMTHERPTDWPKTARPLPTDWDKSDYKYQVVYVSKGTWKLNNLHKDDTGEIDFTWN